MEGDVDEDKGEEWVAAVIDEDRLLQKEVEEDYPAQEEIKENASIKNQDQGPPVGESGQQAASDVVEATSSMHESCTPALNGEDCSAYPYEVCDATDMICVHKDVF